MKPVRVDLLEVSLSSGWFGTSLDPLREFDSCREMNLQQSSENRPVVD